VIRIDRDLDLDIGVYGVESRLDGVLNLLCC
jgi:hypothetical protein